MATDVHPTAVIDPKAKLGEDVKVGPYTIVGPHVSLGDGSQIGPHVVIEGRTTLGKNCKVYQFTSLGSPPQDLKFNNEPSTLEIGDNNVIRESVTMNPGTEHGNMKTVIGNNNLFMVGAHVAHDCIVGDNNVIANNATLAGHVEVGNKVILGGLIAIHQFSRVGDFAILSGGTMAAKDIPPYCIGQGDRARLRGINVIALRRNGFSEDAIKDIRRLYRIFTNGSVKPEAFEQRIQETKPELLEKEYVKLFVEFIKKSSRGILTSSKQEKGLA